MYFERCYSKFDKGQTSSLYYLILRLESFSLELWAEQTIKTKNTKSIISFSFNYTPAAELRNQFGQQN
jgi:hypothetical protein